MRADAETAGSIAARLDAGPRQPAWQELHAIADRAVSAVQGIFRRAVAQTKAATSTLRLEVALTHRLPEAALSMIPWNEIGAKILERRMGDRMTRLIVEAGIIAQRFKENRYLRLGVRTDWDESQHPRGKTTPASTPGSFAPEWTLSKRPTAGGSPAFGMRARSEVGGGEGIGPGQSGSGFYLVHDPAGRLLAEIAISIRGSDARIVMIQAHTPGLPLKAILKEFLRRNPQVKTLSGDRITGLHRGAVSIRADELELDDLAEDLRPQEVSLSFEARNPFAVKAAIEESAKLVRGVSQETINALARMIADAIEEGIPPAKAARLIRAMIGLNDRQAATITKLAASGASESELAKATRKAIAYRAEMIARTETIRAANLGQQVLWKQGKDAGLIDSAKQQEWIATPDDRECPVCAELDGQKFPLGGTIKAGEFGDVTGPPAHPNCRCALSLVSVQ